MIDVALSYVWQGIQVVFAGPFVVELGSVGLSITVLMVLGGFITGILVGATPGLAGPVAMAIALPLLISVFGFQQSALLPVLGFLIGIMKGATVGGSVPAILFNTPGTPDAYMTTLDGHPMARNGQARKALKVAHFASVSGDTFSDLVLILCAPFLAVTVERYLDFPEKTALIMLSLSFIAVIIGSSAGKGLISAGLGLLVAYVATGEDFYPRLSLDQPWLADGFPVTTAVLGVLILGEVFVALENRYRQQGSVSLSNYTQKSGSYQRFRWHERLSTLPYLLRSSFIGTAIGALPGVGSTLAATLGYSLGKKSWARKSDPTGPQFGDGVPAGIVATEAANSSVSGANLIPVLSLGIPGNTAAVFLILAMESISGFNPGPGVFKFTTHEVNPELVMAFGIFTLMLLANLFNWTLGAWFMRWLGFMIRIPREYLFPGVLLLTLTAIYIQETQFMALVFAIGFGVLGYLMRRFGMSPLPFVIAFILGGKLEENARAAFSSTGGDTLFLFSSPVAFALTILALVTVVAGLRQKSN